MHSRQRKQRVESQVAGRMRVSSRHSEAASMIRAEKTERGTGMS